ncbi:unnamed protein product [[Candida] boidinii]|uniref:Unnamed protein product n=1 Tax=Candida boidinii TaxID=5477 RepID=A0ACB5TQG7_CANBO|nr:unnamed protein product [[Candida] boidinii]
MADKTPPKKLLRDKSLLRDFEIFEDTEDLKLIISLDSESLKLKKKTDSSFESPSETDKNSHSKSIKSSECRRSLFEPDPK